MRKVLGILRLIVFVMVLLSLNLCGLFGVLFAKIPSQFVDKEDIAKLMSQLMRAHFKFLLFLCGFEISYEIEEGLDKKSENFLLLSNHVSYMDILVLASWRPMGFVAKSEVGSWPVFGRIVRKYNTLFVDRDCMASRVSCLYALTRQLNSQSYCVFPQGSTRKHIPMEKEPWKAGQMYAARKSGVRVLVASICYQDHDQMAWVDDMTLGPHLWWQLQRPKSRVIVSISLLQEESNESLRARSWSAFDNINQLCISGQRKLAKYPKSSKLNLLSLRKKSQR